MTNLPALEPTPRGRLLLAEDNHELRRLLVAGLRDGWDIEEATDGYELLDRATARQPDLIISDIRMPGLTGLEVLAGLRSPCLPGGWRTPVILITAFGDAATHATAEQLGAVVIDKPFDLDDLRDCVCELTGRSAWRGRREALTCAACGAPVALVPGNAANGVWFCAGCEERAHLDDLAELYDDLGGED